jgi:uncharacterized membrane protein
MAWTPWAILFLGSWLVFSPSAIGTSGSFLGFSDWAAGALAGVVSSSEIASPRPWKRWVLCGVGMWLLFAPLLFWTRSAAGYANDTLTGILIIVLAVAVPASTGEPGEIPPGWSYNPSSWHHRIPVIVLALAGFFVARHMASFQLGHIKTVWEPFFGAGTGRVLTSDVAAAFPISDAGLGATTYLLEALSGLVGDKRRWRTMPWMVLLFFVLVVPAGVVSIVLIMLQPVVVGAWCTPCLITAVATLVSIPPAVDEIFATWQFLAQSRREKKSLWTMFWLGDRSPGEYRVEPHPASGLSGIGMPWNLAVTSVLGVWLVVSPPLLNLPVRGADSDYILGALVTTFAVLAAAEPVRALRFVNIPFAVWIAASPLIFSGMNALAAAHHVASGLLIVALSLRRGRVVEHYGAWDRYIR